MRGFAWGCVVGAPLFYGVAWMDLVAEHYVWALTWGLGFFGLVILGTAVIDQTQTPKGEEHNA